MLRRKKNPLFVNKKKQKTLSIGARRPESMRSGQTKVFCFFLFTKRGFFLPFRAASKQARAGGARMSTLVGYPNQTTPLETRNLQGRAIGHRR